MVKEMLKKNTELVVSAVFKRLFFRFFRIHEHDDGITNEERTEERPKNNIFLRFKISLQQKRSWDMLPTNQRMFSNGRNRKPFQLRKLSSSQQQQQQQQQQYNNHFICTLQSLCEINVTTATTLFKQSHYFFH